MQVKQERVPHVTPLIADADRVLQLKAEAVHLPSWDLTTLQIWDSELLLNGAFSPLYGYLAEADYQAVCGEMRLADGTLWPMPIALDVTESFASKLTVGDRIALRHPEGMVLGILSVSDIWWPERATECRLLFGTTDEMHPGVFQLMHRGISGKHSSHTGLFIWGLSPN